MHSPHRPARYNFDDRRDADSPAFMTGTLPPKVPDVFNPILHRTRPPRHGSSPGAFRNHRTLSGWSSPTALGVPFDPGSDATAGPTRAAG
ncbi:hypothetical protein ACFV47_21570 [Streptomyces solisilvae]|uniref:hypothetical protein n=1 Tax=Streptomyces malaysiensis TaxID=92644 RepID=UPI0036BE7D32